jgi:two-component system chemotaxis response regulator CheY
MTTTVSGTTAPSVLVVDDEPDVRELARAILEMAGFQVIEEAADGNDALARFVDLAPPPVPTVVLLDNRMPGRSGLEVAQEMLRHNPDQVIVLFSAHLDAEVEEAAKNIGVAACVSKMDAPRLPEILRRFVPED